MELLMEKLMEKLMATEREIPMERNWGKLKVLCLRSETNLENISRSAEVI